MSKIVICSSAKFYDQAQEWKETLESQGFEVIRAVQSIDPSSLSQYENTHREHYEKMAESDIVFILNLEKNGIEGYIGASVFAEIAFAIGLNLTLKKNIQIWLLNPIPKESQYLDELTKWEKLGWIKQYSETSHPALS